jgi:hypothetical protein
MAERWTDASVRHGHWRLASPPDTAMLELWLDPAREPETVAAAAWGRSVWACDVLPCRATGEAGSQKLNSTKLLYCT